MWRDLPPHRVYGPSSRSPALNARCAGRHSKSGTQLGYHTIGWLPDPPECRLRSKAKSNVALAREALGGGR
jgi:hypothetical protein